MIGSNVKKEFNCSIEKLWDIITNNTDYAWRSDLSKIEVIDDKHFVEYAKNNFPTYFTITAKHKYEEYRFDIENANIKGKWIGLFRKLPNGNTELDFTEEVEADSPVMKLLAKPYLKSQQKRFLKDLGKKLNEKIQFDATD